MKCVVICLAGMIAAIGAAQAGDCVNADPNSLLGTKGDFEIRADPQDPAGNLLYAANMASSVIVARLSGQIWRPR